jgi:hypothetical protein
MRGRSWRVLLLLPLGALAFCAGCSAANVEHDDLVGDFRADYGFGIESLRFARDGHYDQLFRERGAETWTANSGMWEFKSGAMPIVLLHDSLQVEENGALRPAYGEPMAGTRSLQVKKGMRALSILDERSGKTFDKVD